MSRRLWAMAGLAAVCVTAVAVLAAVALVDASHDRAASDRAVAADRPQADQVLAGNAPFAVLRTADRSHDQTFGRVAVASLERGAPGAPALVGPACSRVAFGAGRGLCLDVLGTEMTVKVLDEHLRVIHDFSLPGIPSRARISPDGRWAGTTAFVVGHSYAAPGQFSTSTRLIDLEAGKPVGDLEKDFTVTRDGKVVDARDRNYWGLTFAADGDTFFATLATGGETYLVKGSIKTRVGHTIHENVECPSLSPDGTRIGYKKAVGQAPARWRFHVLDLATGEETPLSETRSIDDQLAWLDDERLLYGDGERTWVVNADGSGEPGLWMRSADSVTVSTRP